MKSEDGPLFVSFLLLVLFVLIGMGQGILSFAIADENVVNATATSLGKAFGTHFKDVLVQRFVEIISSPFRTPEMLWIAIPLLIVLLFTQIYFGRWKTEKIGWGSAFANWIALLFVGINLFREMLAKYAGMPSVPIEALYKFLLVFMIFAISVSFMVVLFLHAIPKSISFVISSPLTIYSFAFIMIAIVYSDIPLDLSTLIVALFVYILILLIFKLVKLAIPPSEQARKYLEEKEVEEKKKNVIQKAVKTRKKHEVERERKKWFRRVIRKLWPRR